jgi:hypothetical protein
MTLGASSKACVLGVLLAVLCGRALCADSPILDTQSYPYIGVTLAHYSATNPPQNINVVDIDLSAPGLQFRVTPEVLCT